MTKRMKKRIVYVSPFVFPELELELIEEGFTIKHTNKLPNADQRLALHADMILCEMPKKLFCGSEDAVSMYYPMDVRYNAVCCGRFFVHNLQYTDEELMSEAKTQKLQAIHVNQGYTKCNTLVVDDTKGQEAIITSDEGIANVLKALGVDVLLIEAGHIKLEGYDYGFIGGCSGKYEDTIYFNGDVCAHPNGYAILTFIEEHGKQAKYFENLPLTDIGSIIFAK